MTDSNTEGSVAGAEYLSSLILAQMTGIPPSTWRYWAMCGTGPRSFKIGRRRVWKRSVVEAWLREQEEK
jgi:prophage regulatory protein